ncbi:hypothetical protein GQ42DRAFT_164382 [Ramicandelaber brevisporus]|nr:hypothetical protein GQ42DRAFT_164382 [Ramicandelaber brevisporus]
MSSESFSPPLAPPPPLPPAASEEIWDFRSPSQQVGATRRSKTFYSDIGVSQDATREQVLDAAANKFFELLGISQSDHGDANNADGELEKTKFIIYKRTLYVAFSTLYDPISRDAYDVLGDGMFAHFGIESGTRDSHPSYFYRFRPRFLWIGLAIIVAVLATCGGLYLGSIYGDKIVGMLRVWLFAYPVFTILSRYPENWLTLCDFGVTAANALGLQLGSSAMDSADMPKISPFAMRHGLNMAPTINQYMMEYIPWFAMLTIAYPTSLFWSAQPDDHSKYAAAIILLIILMGSLLSIASLIRCKFTTNPQLSMLFKAVDRKLDDWYPDGEANTLIRSRVKEVLKSERDDNHYSLLKLVSDFIGLFVVVINIVVYTKDSQKSIMSLISTALPYIQFGLFFYIAIFTAVIAFSIIASTAKHWRTTRSSSSQDKKD